MTTKEEQERRNKLILDSFGILFKPENADQLKAFIKGSARAARQLRKRKREIKKLLDIKKEAVRT